MTHHEGTAGLDPRSAANEAFMTRTMDFHAEWDAVRYAKLSAASYVQEARRLRQIGMPATAYSTLVRAACWRAEAQRLATFPQGRSMAQQDLDWFVHTAWADRLRVYL